MSEFNNTYNFSDDTERSVIAGLLSFLRDKIKYTNYREDKEQEISVPFFFSFTGDSRFIQDFFSEENTGKADTNYEVVPRGVVKYEGSSVIKSDELTNPYVRAKYQKEIDGRLLDYSAFFRRIPIQMDMEIEIIVDSHINSLKISSEIKRTFYKNKIYQIQVEGLRIPCLIRFPEDLPTNRLLEYGFTDDKMNKMTFPIEVHSFLYDLVGESDIFAGNRMKSIINNLNT